MGEDFMDDEEFDKPLKLSGVLGRTGNVIYLIQMVERSAFFKNEDLYHVMDKMRLSYDDYTEDVCLVANMLYSDLYDVFGQLIPPDKEAYYWVAAAKSG